ncbi:MAG: hypothetical protein ACK56F_08340, partial [bacterium]
SGLRTRGPGSLARRGAFQLRNIADERSRFFNCLHALPEATVCLIADLVEADPLPATPTQSCVAACWLRTS